MPKSDSHRADELLASVSQDIFGDLPQALQDLTIRVERILLEMVRPDPVQSLTVLDISQGATRMFRIETGERRYWATWLLRDFIPENTSDGMIPCIIIQVERSSVFRQAKENAHTHLLPPSANPESFSGFRSYRNRMTGNN